MSRCYTVPHVYTYAIQHDPQISRYTNKVQCELQKQNMYPYSLSLSLCLPVYFDIYIYLCISYAIIYIEIYAHLEKVHFLYFAYTFSPIIVIYQP